MPRSLMTRLRWVCTRLRPGEVPQWPRRRGLMCSGGSGSVSSGVSGREVAAVAREVGGGAPVAEKARLDVLGGERLGEQRVVEEVDLARREIVGGTPVRVERGG